MMTTLGSCISLQEIPSSQLHLLPEILNEEIKNNSDHITRKIECQ